MCTGNKIRTISHVKYILLICVKIRKNSAEWSVHRNKIRIISRVKYVLLICVKIRKRVCTVLFICFVSVSI